MVLNGSEELWILLSRVSLAFLSASAGYGRHICLANIQLLVDIKQPKPNTNMLLITLLIPIIIIEVNAVSGLSIDPKVVCSESQYVEYNHKAVISCEYDKGFYTVRWHLNNSTDSFLRIDGKLKSGSGLVTGEYDIEEDGSMVIKRVDFGNEGQYTVSVLNVDGILSKARIVVHVFVPLRELTVHYCNVSKNEVCKEAGVTEEKTAVICIAKNTKPQVELTWQTLGGMTASPVSSMTNVTLKLNDTMPLYSAYSVFKYDSNLFTMQYFTCIASGSAVRDVSNASLLVKGYKQYDDVTSRYTYVVEGESLPLECPRASNPFGQLSVTFLNGSSNLILEWNSLTQQQCSSPWECEISTNGLVSIVMPGYNISFECISSSGVKTTKDVIHPVNIAISPNSVIRIGGCDNTDSACQRVTGRIGNVTCTLPDTRMEVHLTFQPRESNNPAVSISSESNYIVEHTLTSTLDNVVTSEYHIEQCNEIVQLTCSPILKEFHQYLESAVIQITADGSECQQTTSGLAKTIIIVSVIVCIVLIAVLSVVLYNRYIKTTPARYETRDEETGKGLSKQNKQKTSHHHHETEEENKSMIMEQTCSDQQDEETEGSPLMSNQANEDMDQEKAKPGIDTSSDNSQKQTEELKNEPKSIGLQETDANNYMQKMFDDTFQSFFEKIYVGKATDGEFQRLLKTFILKNKNAVPKTLLVESIKHSQPAQKDLLAVIKFFSTSGWISSDAFNSLLQTAVEMEQLSPKDGLNLIGEYFSKEKIDSKVYARITANLIKQKKIKIDHLLTKLRQASTTRKYPRPDLAEAFIQYYVFSVLERKTIEKTIQMDFKQSKDKIPYMFFLLAIEGEYEQSECKDKLMELFNAILTKSKSELGDSGIESTESDIIKALTSIINLIVSSNMLKTDILMDILQNRCLNGKITVTLLCNVLVNLLENEKIALNEYIAQIKMCLLQHVITESDFVNLFSTPLNKGKLSIRDFLSELKQCREQNMIKEKEFIDLLSSLVNHTQFNLHEYIDGITGCKKNKMITDDLFLSLLPKSLECQQVTAEDYASELKRCLMEKLINEGNFVRLVLNIPRKRELSQVTDEISFELLASVLECEGVSFKEYAIELRTCYKDKLISKDNLVRILSNLMQHTKINIQDFMEEVKYCKEDSIISEEDIQHMFTICVNSDNVDGKTLMEYTIFLSKENLIGEENVILLMKTIVDKFEVTKQDMKTLTEGLQKDLSVYKKLMKIKFHQNKDVK